MSVFANNELFNEFESTASDLAEENDCLAKLHEYKEENDLLKSQNILHCYVFNFSL